MSPLGTSGKYQTILFGFLFYTHVHTNITSHWIHSMANTWVCVKVPVFIINPTTSVQLINCDLLIAYCYSLGSRYTK